MFGKGGIVVTMVIIHFCQPKLLSIVRETGIFPKDVFRCKGNATKMFCFDSPQRVNAIL